MPISAATVAEPAARRARGQAKTMLSRTTPKPGPKIPGGVKRVGKALGAAGLAAGVAYSGYRLGKKLRGKKQEKTAMMNHPVMVGFLDELMNIKTAKVLTTGAREKIKGKFFAVKKKGEEPAYPIHDPKHAKNALTRVRQFGSPSEKAKVFAAVSKKYPALATRSEVIPPKLQRKAEKKVGVGKGEESQKKEKTLQKVSANFQKAMADVKKKAKGKKKKGMFGPGTY